MTTNYILKNIQAIRINEDDIAEVKINGEYINTYLSYELLDELLSANTDDETRYFD